MKSLDNREYSELANSDTANALLEFAEDKLLSDPHDEEAKYWIIHAYHLLNQHELIINRGKKFLNEISNRVWLGRIYNRIGTAYFALADFPKADHHYSFAEQLLTEYGEPTDLAGIFNNIGILLEMKGELNKALDYYQRSVALKREFGRGVKEAPTLTNIGVIYHMVEDYDNALLTFQEAERIFREQCEVEAVAMTMFHQFNSHLMLEDYESAQDLAKKMTKVAERNKEILFCQHTDKLIQALLLKNTTTLEAKGRALIELMDFCKLNKANINLRLVAVKSLIELRIEEYKIFENIKILDEIKILIQQMEKLSTENNMFPLMVDVFLLKAKLMEAQGKFHEVKNLLVEINEIVENRKLDYLLPIIQRENDKFEAHLIEVKRVVDQNEIVVKKVEINFLEDYLKSLKL